MPLTDIAIRNAKPGITPQGKPTPKPYKMGDAGGLYLEVFPAGGKLWRLKYRFDGKEKRLAFGAYPEVGLKDARERRDEARKLLAQGIDPGAAKRATKAAKAAHAANTFEAIAKEWMTTRGAEWSASYASKTKAAIERHALPAIGSRPLNDITAPEILAMLRAIEHRGT